MPKTRFDKAREAFRKKDFKAAAAAHSSSNIEKDSQEEPHKAFALSDIILGGQDGLVNVLGVILGVAAASSDIRIVIAAGFAAAFAESVSMGAVAYTSTLSEADHYESERKREAWEIEHFPDQEKEEIRQIYKKRGFSGKLLDDVVSKIVSDKRVWLDVMMGEELKIEPTSRSNALRSALIVGVSAIVGSIIPLVPFWFLPLNIAIYTAILLGALTLFIVGIYKANITVGSKTKSGLELMTIGIVSALIGYFIGSLFKAPVTP